MKKKRKKYTVFNIKRRSDGSFEKKKSVIYKDYNPKKLMAREKNSTQGMQYYVGSAAAIKKVLEQGQHQISLKHDGTIELKLRNPNTESTNQDDEMNKTYQLLSNKINLSNKSQFDLNKTDKNGKLTKSNII